MLHHHNLIGDLTHNRQIVGDEQVAQALFRLQVIEQSQHLILHQHVQSGYGLVADNHVRIESHGSCDGDALTLTTGKLVRVAETHGPRQFHHIEQLTHAGSTTLLVSNAVDTQWFFDGTVNGVHRVKRTIRILEHRLHVAAEVKQFLALEAGNVLAFISDGA